MSNIFPEQNWHLGFYNYPFYRYTLEEYAYKAKPQKLLDAGCGKRGSSLSRFNSGLYVGIDILRENVDASKKKNPSKDYVLASLDALPFKDSTFDGIVCVDVIEHVEDKQSVFDELSRVVEENGVFVGSTSNQFNPMLFFDSTFPSLSAPLQRKFAPGHYERHKRVSPKSLTQGLAASGFKCEYRIFGFPLFNPWFYHHRNLRVPLYGYLWICLDQLCNNKVLRFLKETLVWSAKKHEN